MRCHPARAFARRYAVCLAAWLTALSASPAIDDTLPLRSAAPDGLGPLALNHLHHEILGAAFVFGSAKPDLFVVGSARNAAKPYLLRWLRDTPEGVPVFAAPAAIASPVLAKASVLQTADGVIHGLWLDGKKLRHAVFDKDRMSFREEGAIDLPGLPAAPQSVAAFPNPDGSADIALEIPEDRPGGKRGDPSSEDWRPYDAAGIATTLPGYRYLFGARLPGTFRGPAEQARQISPGTREALGSMVQLAPAGFGGPGERGLVTGSRMGNFLYFPFAGTEGMRVAGRHLLAGPDGIALRHPSISPSVAAYPGSSRGPNLIAAGEGALFFYQYTGSSTAGGAPMFQEPVPVLQENAELYAGTLPSPSVADWDGDGTPDLLVGNSEGFVLYFRNVGTRDDPRFLPGERVQAGGRDLHVQAGYSGSVQGVGEARWGYVSPTVVDWTEDGLPDIILGDITGNFTICINRGTAGNPVLDAPRPLYCDGLDLHGMWRCRAAVGRLGNRMGLAIIDGDDNFHLYWKIDDRNVSDGGKLKMSDGRWISASYDPAGGTGRCKLDWFDGDRDGILDLVIGTGRRSAIPDRLTGLPMPALGWRTLGTPLYMRNVGTNQEPVFAMPVPFVHRTLGIIQPGGSHERGAVLTDLGGNGPNLLTADEVGRLYLYRGENLKFAPEPARTGNTP